MSAVSDLVPAVAGAFGLPAPAVRNAARALIDAGLLPKSRGRRVAEAEAIHIVRLALAALIAPKLRDAAATVAAYEAMTRGGRYALDDDPAFWEGRILRLGDVLADLLTSLAGTPRDGAALEVVCSWPEATLRLPADEAAGGKPRTLRFVPERTEGEGWRAPIRRSVEVPGPALAALARATLRD